MKKFISLSIVMLMVVSALMLTACGGGSSEDLSDSKYVGTWKSVALALGDDSEDMDGDMILIINGDGTGTMLSEGDEDSDFTWELTRNGFKTKGDVKLKFKDDGDRIKTKIIGADLIFEKQ
jgi:hypothetical protein